MIRREFALNVCRIKEVGIGRTDCKKLWGDKDARGKAEEEAERMGKNLKVA